MRRTTCLLAALTALLVAAPASATTCPLLADAAGDGAWDAMPLVNEPQLDVLSADVATGSTTLVAVLRVDEVDESPETALGVTWLFGWHVGTVRYELSARRGFGGVIRSDFTVNGAAVPHTVALDTTADTITWTAARTDLSGLGSGATFSMFAARSAMFGVSADEAFDATNTYVDQDPGCVPAS